MLLRYIGDNDELYFRDYLIEHPAVSHEYEKMKMDTNKSPFGGQLMNELIQNIEKLHTTPMGIERIKKNLSLDVPDVLEWCRHEILGSSAAMERKGKNWYVNVNHYEITVNAHSCTIITAHRK